GASDTNWGNCRNWGYGTIPSYSTGVTIPGGCSFYPIVPGDVIIMNAVGGACKSVKIESGGSLTMSANHSLTVDGTGGALTVQSGGNLIVTKDLILQNSAILNQTGGDITIGGNFTNNAAYSCTTGDVIFNGSSLQEISGSNSISFYDITLNNTSTGVTLSQNIEVRRNLTMTDGDLDLVNSNVSLGSSGEIISEANTRRIKVGDPSINTGRVTCTATINNGTFSPANLGVDITTNQNLGSITIVRGHKIQEGSYGGSSTFGVARYYEITGIDSLGGESLVLHYWDNELNGHNEDSLEGFQWVTEGRAASWWTPLDGTVNPGLSIFTTSANPYDLYFTTSTWYGFIWSSRFTLGSKQDPLPIVLLEQNVSCIGEGAKIEWVTGTEVNNDYFSIERSIDTYSFEEIGQVPGAGNSNSILNYSFIDDNLQQAFYYYRLKQTDYDGEYVNFDIMASNCSVNNHETDIHIEYHGSYINAILDNADFNKEFVIVLGTMSG
ncbi:MAG: hypothetical protein KAH32_09135, partial [Chlamydiia bacterium]|nr:hypothetical protein [Chlamydiia bacterium]